MSVCCCSLAGTAACKHCSNNPFAESVWSNTYTTDHIEAKPFGDGVDVCPVCGKPSTIGKPYTNADRIRAMSDEELADWVWGAESSGRAYGPRGKKEWLRWLKEAAHE